LRVIREAVRAPERQYYWRYKETTANIIGEVGRICSANNEFSRILFFAK
jgi:hypothetical protein